MQMPPLDTGRDVLGAHECTVSVSVSTRRITRWRLYLGMKIIVFGGWIVGFAHTHVDIEQ